MMATSSAVEAVSGGITALAVVGAGLWRASARMARVEDRIGDLGEKVDTLGRMCERIAQRLGWSVWADHPSHPAEPDTRL